MLEHKVAAVTGAGSGIGRAIAQLLATRGAKVAVIDINVETAAGLGGSGGGAACVAAKHGVVGLTKQMAVAYAARGVTVNCVCVPASFRRTFVRTRKHC